MPWSARDGHYQVIHVIKTMGRAAHFIYNIELLLVSASKEPHVRPRDVINQAFQLLLSDPSTDNWEQEEFFSHIAQFMTSCYAVWNEHWCSSERKLNALWGNVHNH